MCMCVYNFFFYFVRALHRVTCIYASDIEYCVGLGECVYEFVVCAKWLNILSNRQETQKKKGWFENLKWTRRRRCGFFVFAIQPNAMSMRILINIIDLMSMRWSCWPNRFKIDSIESIALFRLQYWMMHEKLHLSTDSAHNRIDDYRRYQRMTPQIKNNESIVN